MPSSKSFNVSFVFGYILLVSIASRLNAFRVDVMACSKYGACSSSSLGLTTSHFSTGVNRNSNVMHKSEIEAEIIRILSKFLDAFMETIKIPNSKNEIEDIVLIGILKCISSQSAPVKS